MFPRVWENFRLNVKCFKVFCSTEEPSYWGPVHTNPFSNENGAVLLRHDRLPDHSTVSIQNGGQAPPCSFNFAGRYIEMRMRRVHLTMRTEGIKAFSKRIRCCRVDGRKRYKLIAGLSRFACSILLSAIGGLNFWLTKLGKLICRKACLNVFFSRILDWWVCLG